MSIELLKRDLKENNLHKAYLFYGSEKYLVQHYTKELEKRLIDASAASMNYNLFEGAKNLKELYNACIAYPFFAERRFVVVKNSGAFKAKKTSEEEATTDAAQTNSSSKTNKSATAKTGKTKGKGKKDRKGAAGGASAITFESVLEDLPETTCLLFIEDEVDKRKKLYTMMNKDGLVVEFPYQKTPELTVWVENIAKKNNTRFEPRAIRMFMEKTGESMTEIKNELDKVLSYCGNKKVIAAEDVFAVCSFSIKTRIFDLMDSVAAGNKLKAFMQLEELITLKEPVQKIMILLSKHLIQMLQMKTFMRNGMNLSEITDFMKLNPYHAKILSRQCGNFTFEQLTAAVENCYERDSAVKSGRMDGNLALETLIASI